MDPTGQKAVFLSYASQDVDAAWRIAAALREAGIEAWFDQSELRGGDEWDQKIRGQIRSCTLLIPIVSASTQKRGEGYFRREWKLAAERTHDIAAGIPFLVPVVIDDTPESAALAPEEFMRVQWTRLAGGAATPQFVSQVKTLLEAPRGVRAGSAAPASQPASTAAPVARGISALAWLGAIAGLAVIAGFSWFVLARKGDGSPPPGSPPTAPGAPVAGKAARGAVEKSVAVLPFAILGGDKDREFAEGLHGDVIAHLQKIRDLKKVISRTSVLAFRAEAARNLVQIAEELGVATVVEATVQRMGNRVKVNAALIEARTEASLWADTLSGDTSDIFALQAAIAQKIALALAASLTEGEKSLIARRHTQSPAAYELFLKARALDDNLSVRSGLAEFEQVVSAYQRTLAEDPGIALVYSRLTNLHGLMYWLGQLDPTPQRRSLAEAALREAVRIDSESPETHYARGAFAYHCDYDWPRALQHCRQAELGLPQDAALQSMLGYIHRRMGNWREYLRHLERALELGPGFLYAAAQLADSYLEYRRYEQSRNLAMRFAALFPEDPAVVHILARSEFALNGNHGAFLAAMAKVRPSGFDSSGLEARYEWAMFAGELDEAERTLADPRMPGITDTHGIHRAPVALHRALVAHLQGKRESARRHADEAISEFTRRQWTPRQRPVVHLGIASAKAYAGRLDEAIPEARAAMAEGARLDAQTGMMLRFIGGGMLAAVGQSDDALVLLRELMAGPCRFTPNEIRIDPRWSGLKRDPRFEQVLKSAKRL